jgi:hypothetical protein
MSSALTRALRMRGFDVETAQELGMRGIPDEVHLQYAASQGRTLFSFNRRDYIRIHGEWLTAGRTHSGIHPSRPAETRHRLPTPWPPRHGRDSRPGRNGRLPHRNLEPRPPNTRSSDDVSPPAISGTFPPPRASVRHRLLRCRTKRACWRQGHGHAQSEAFRTRRSWRVHRRRFARHARNCRDARERPEHTLPHSNAVG